MEEYYTTTFMSTGTFVNEFLHLSLDDEYTAEVLYFAVNYDGKVLEEKHMSFEPLDHEEIGMTADRRLFRLFLMKKYRRVGDESLETILGKKLEDYLTEKKAEL